ncbi:MAG: amidase family protein [Marinilabiliales bacterium]|nr:amidase family protein [Marinilabiliales bacterium]
MKRVVYGASSSAYGDSRGAAQVARTWRRMPLVALRGEQVRRRAVLPRVPPGLRARDASRCATSTSSARARTRCRSTPRSSPSSSTRALAGAAARHLRRRRAVARLHLRRATWSTRTCWPARRPRRAGRDHQHRLRHAGDPERAGRAHRPHRRHGGEAHLPAAAHRGRAPLARRHPQGASASSATGPGSASRRGCAARWTGCASSRPDRAGPRDGGRHDRDPRGRADPAGPRARAHAGCRARRGAAAAAREPARAPRPPRRRRSRPTRRRRRRARPGGAAVSDDLCFLGAAELARRMARRELSPVEVVRAHLGRIAALGPRLNAFLLVTAERALEEARAAERRDRRGPPPRAAARRAAGAQGSLRRRGTRHHRRLADPRRERGGARRRGLRAAGRGRARAASARRTCTSSPSAPPATTRTTVPAATPGTSRAARAARAAAAVRPSPPGSVPPRWARTPAARSASRPRPAAWWGSSPRWGAASVRGVVPLCWSLDTVGPMARTVEDVALLLDVIAGPDAGGRVRAPRGRRSRSRASWRRARRASRWACRASGSSRASSPGSSRRWRRRWRRSSGEGAHRGRGGDCPAWPGRTPRTTPSSRSRPPRSTAGGCASARTTTATTCGAGCELGSLIPAVDYVNARRAQTVARRTFAAALERADVLVTPALPQAPLRVGEPMSREPAVAWNRLLTPFNLAGLPALSVPCGFDAAGLPVGLQIVGAPFAGGAGAARGAGGGAGGRVGHAAAAGRVVTRERGGSRMQRFESERSFTGAGHASWRPRRASSSR